ncbi:unnamed protein product [Ectocarpus fasciculatus]
MILVAVAAAALGIFNEASPTTMRAALCSSYGPVDEVLSVVEDAPRPTFEPAGKASRGYALVRVQATALAPGDIRVLSGRTAEIQGPPSLPYVPGGADLCGVVEAVADGETYLKVGDKVVSQFDRNWGGLAEYALAKSSQCARNPPAGLSPAEAAATASSGASAVVISRHVKRGDRVLVIGGSGGVGSFLVQLVRAKGASYVAAVSTQTELMTELGADKAIDYREEDVWASSEFQAEAGKFDVVFDLVEKGWDRVTSKGGRAKPIVKTGWRGGRFVTTVPPCGKWFDGHSMWQIIRVFMLPVLSKIIATSLWPWGRPRYKFAFGLGIDAKRTQFAELFALIEAGDVRVVLDGGRPRPFTTDEIRAAFKLQESGHAHGKVVVQVAD